MGKQNWLARNTRYSAALVQQGYQTDYAQVTARTAGRAMRQCKRYAARAGGCYTTASDAIYWHYHDLHEYVQVWRT